MTWAVEGLRWTLLPPVGGPPFRLVSGQEHLSSRVRPCVLAVGDRVLVWGGRDQSTTDDRGRPRPPEIGSGITIDRTGHVVRRWTIDWHAGDTAALFGDCVVVAGPGAEGCQRALVFEPDHPEAAERYPSSLASRDQPAAFSGSALMVWGGDVPNDRMERVRGRSWPTDEGAVFDVATLTWTPIAPAPIEARSRHVLEAVGDEVVVWGGKSWPQHAKARPLADGAVYDTATGRWRAMSPGPLSPRSMASSLTVGHRVFIWSGFGGASNAYRGDGALYDPESDTWTMLAEAPVRKPGAVAAAVGSLVLLSGGTYAGGRDVRLLIYDASSDDWATPDLPQFSPGPASFAPLSNGDLYAWSFVDPTTEHAILSGLPGHENPGMIAVSDRRTVVARETRAMVRHRFQSRT